MIPLHHLLWGALSAVAATAAATTAPVVPEVPSPHGYIVSPDGNDKASGDDASPFASLGRAVQAMRTGGTKTVCLRNGIYILSSPLTLDRADSGATIRSCPGHAAVVLGPEGGVAPVVILRNTRSVSISGLTLSNGGGPAALSLTRAFGNTISGNHLIGNLKGIVLSAGSSRNVISGNQIDHSAQSAIEVRDGSNANTFDSNLINGTGALGTQGGGFWLHGVSDNVISHNLVENTAGLGIGILNWDKATINIGNIVAYNVVRHVNSAAESIDSGAIYVLGRSEVNSRTSIYDNIVDGTGAPHPAHTVAVYLDDLSSGIMVRNNILTGIGSDAIQIHGGRNNTVVNNIINTGADKASAILFQSAPADTSPTIQMTDNKVTGNIICSASTNPKIFISYNGGEPTIDQNLYYNTTGASMAATGPVKDLHPQFASTSATLPDRCDHTLAQSSSALSIRFQPIDTTRIGLKPAADHWYPVPDPAQ
jgi:parallel beta-helix repeat protein